MDRFGDYMFYLLPAALKKMLQTNQFLIFFRVIGREFDCIKDTLLGMREESSILTAGESMLSVYGNERKMYRFAGEQTEDYRRRLMLKAEVAALAGTRQGLIKAMLGMGYDHCTIEAAWETEPDRWAEIYISFHDDLDISRTVDFEAVRREVLRIKQASTYPNYRTYYPMILKTKEEVGDCRDKHTMVIPEWENLLILDGSWVLDGSHNLNAMLLKATVYDTHRIEIEMPVGGSVGGTYQIKNNVHWLDGSWSLDGTITLNTYITDKEAL